ncbi:hypothetical protein BJY16_003019 [Actinoplanes octamycinicus]|uniref:Uncharacterized protein n=1 Tax=Actinoplanes octamycinicus TaxID=135948 RepID=A0A7W7M785_9ACTN|nr:hypothetical protein [Actinoplanes octamycinicus]MBB4739560.1 hypothetical protein [Actinoplanes octamycinicus]GIE54741.1 hypothetical protein Aoc01nite_01430 [Actinoplanes octamycinicus]
MRGRDAAAVAINDAGVVAGALGAAPDEVPARWASVTAAPVPLPLPPGATHGVVEGLDEDGTVVGRVGSETGLDSGYLWWPGGTGQAMRLPTVDGRRASAFWPTSISNGWVAGDAVFESPRQREFTPMRYRITSGAYERLDGLWRAELITPNGWVAGAGEDTPALLAGPAPVRLPGLDREAASYMLTSISDDGRTISGYSSGPDVSNDPLLWRCR